MLSESERAAFSLVHEDWCHHDVGCCSCCCDVEQRTERVEAALAGRETALRDSIAREIEASGADTPNGRLAAIARGGDHA